MDTFLVFILATFLGTVALAVGIFLGLLLDRLTEMMLR